MSYKGTHKCSRLPRLNFGNLADFAIPLIATNSEFSSGTGIVHVQSWAREQEENPSIAICNFPSNCDNLLNLFPSGAKYCPFTDFINAVGFACYVTRVSIVLHLLHSSLNSFCYFYPENLTPSICRP